MTAPRSPAERACNISADFPVWSRGIAQCCDIYPSTFKQTSYMKSYFEVGDIEYETVDIPKSSVVYVPSLQLPAFANRLLKLPMSTRITLVTGQEDLGMPREAWCATQRGGHGTPSYSVLGVDACRTISSSIGRLPVSLEDFVQDARLVHWFAQNYDLTGMCVTCATTFPSELASELLSLVNTYPFQASRSCLPSSRLTPARPALSGQHLALSSSL